MGGSAGDKGCTVITHDKSAQTSYYEKKDVFSANSITAHKHGGVFTSGGGDGRVHFMSKGSGRKWVTIKFPHVAKSTFSHITKIGVA
eukprot:GAHX01001581.1.p2 GENE.GAHX01001581.1~~GAHX01001581.1.p2  ORF type:complete len:87 (+),score=7.27 GAHX01001581.1:1418-1678(+)